MSDGNWSSGAPAVSARCWPLTKVLRVQKASSARQRCVGLGADGHFLLTMHDTFEGRAALSVQVRIRFK
jgi:hypothetical protein